MNVSIYLTGFFILILNSVDSNNIEIGEKWWGPGNETSIRPYKIIFCQDMVQDLRQRLWNTRPSKPTFKGVGFEYGFNTQELPSWLYYWASAYPFGERQEFLNQFPQFKTNIQGLDIHFIRVVPVVPDGVEIVPLLLLHGWPGSVREFYETIPFLTSVSADRNFALEVIAPSLPGFGFSDSADRPGLNGENIAVVLRNLMHRLGHRKFYVQGGDWGGLVGADLSTLFQKEVLGFHTNFALSGIYYKGLFQRVLGAFNSPSVVEPASNERMYSLNRTLILLRETGYLHLQATKPDTLGIGLSDSPAGLLSYIFQIISTGTRSYYVSREDGGLNHYPRDTLIDNLMMYWVSNSITTSFRIYTESFNKQLSVDGVYSKPTNVPTWVLQAPWEIVYQSPAILKTKYPNLIHATVLNDGGHFCLTMLLKIFGLVALAGAGWFLYSCFTPRAPLAEMNPHEWWGPNELKGKLDHTVRPFKIKFDEELIKDLRNRLKNHRKFTPPLEGVGFEYGFNSGQLESWLKYWAEEYPFQQRENFLNQFPQFKTHIQGLDIHFIRVKPQVPANVQVVPILLLHGWPGSVREFYEAIPLLTKQNPDADFAFEVIVPSLPGYGFSDPAVRPGLAIPQVAVIFRNLMHRLGHKKFYVQGGDWGSGIAAAISTLFQDDVLGHHNNMPSAMNTCAMIRTAIGAWVPSLIVESHLWDRMYPLSKTFAYFLEEFGYFHLQATKPDTVGVALTDSPAGLLAYILEKFAVWTRRDHKFKVDGGLNFRFSKEQLIDNLMLYWSTNSITTSMRFYAENTSKKARAEKWQEYPSQVPTWVFQAKHEIMYQPPHILRFKYPNLLNATVLDDGGHFLALELPKIFAEDVFKAVKAFRNWRKEGKTEL